jgi:hypothetical protein
MDIKRTEHYFWFLCCCLLRHMVHLPSVGWPWVHLLVAIILTLRGLLTLLLGAMISIMSNFSTAKACVGGARRTGLHGSVVRSALVLSLTSISAIGGVDCHSAAGTGDAAETDYGEGSNQDSTN